MEVDEEDEEDIDDNGDQTSGENTECEDSMVRKKDETNQVDSLMTIRSKNYKIFLLKAKKSEILGPNLGFNIRIVKFILRKSSLFSELIFKDIFEHFRKILTIFLCFYENTLS